MDRSKKLPQEPELRRVLLVLSRTQILALEENAEENSASSESELLSGSNPQVQIIEFERAIKSKDPLIKKIRERRNIFNVGNVLIQDPYDPDSGYELLSESAEQYSLAKRAHIADYFCLLGVKRVKVEQLEMKSFEGKMLFSGGIDAAGITTGKAKVESNALEKMRESIKVAFDNLELKPDADYQELVRKKVRMMDEYAKLSVFEHRLIKKGSFHLEIDFSSESRRTLGIAMGLEVPAILKLNAQFEKTREQSYQYKMIIEACWE